MGSQAISGTGRSPLAYIRALVAALRSRRILSATSPAPLVREFHEAFGLPIADRPAFDGISSKQAELRVRLLLEEAEEYRSASERGDLPAVADALADVVYVAYGSALEWGIDLDQALLEVHATNMSKGTGEGGPMVDSSGKVMKPRGWRAPTMARALGVPGKSESK